jgi:hypothetical protein
LSTSCREGILYRRQTKRELLYWFIPAEKRNYRDDAHICYDRNARSAEHNPPNAEASSESENQIFKHILREKGRENSRKAGSFCIASFSTRVRVVKKMLLAVITVCAQLRQYKVLGCEFRTPPSIFLVVDFKRQSGGCSSSSHISPFVWDF